MMKQNFTNQGHLVNCPSYNKYHHESNTQNGNNQQKLIRATNAWCMLTDSLNSITKCFKCATQRERMANNTHTYLSMTYRYKRIGKEIPIR